MTIARSSDSSCTCHQSQHRNPSHANQRRIRTRYQSPRRKHRQKRKPSHASPNRTEAPTDLQRRSQVARLVHQRHRAGGRQERPQLPGHQEQVWQARPENPGCRSKTVRPDVRCHFAIDAARRCPKPEMNEYWHSVHECTCARKISYSDRAQAQIEADRLNASTPEWKAQRRTPATPYVCRICRKIHIGCHRQIRQAVF